jgi:hypothetical protein
MPEIWPIILLSVYPSIMLLPINLLHGVAAICSVRWDTWLRVSISAWPIMTVALRGIRCSNGWRRSHERFSLRMSGAAVTLRRGLGGWSFVRPARETGPEDAFPNPEENSENLMAQRE